jgi:DNA-binding NtrC family response regulator
VHYARRSAGALLPLECALLGAELLQANLRALARPHASAERPATLVLQDVDEMPLEAQAELAGFVRLVDLPVKIVSTARRMLIELAEVGQFRYDLACALSTIAIELVPLADRLDDLPLAAQWQLERANAAGAKQLAGFSSEALDRLAAHDWPGDVGELAEVVAEAHARAEGGDVQLRDLPLRLHQASDAARFARPPDETIVLETFLGEIEHELIERALSRAKGNKAQAARLLGMTRPRLYRRLVQLGFEEPVIFEEEVEE